MARKDLLIDIGNSFVEYGYCDFSQPELPKTFVSKKIPTPQFPDHISNVVKKDCRSIVVSSVVPKMDSIINALPIPSVFVTHRLFQNSKLAIKNRSQIGADRLVNAIAAHVFYKGPSLVIDSGTATTCCFIDEKGVYQGGAIMPGMGMSSRALHSYTAKIPLIKVKDQRLHYGKNTTEAVQAGLFWGHIHMLNGFIQHYREQYPAISVIGTGSGLATLNKKLDLDTYDPQLIFKGLFWIGLYKYNRNLSKKIS